MPRNPGPGTALAERPESRSEHRRRARHGRQDGQGKQTGLVPEQRVGRGVGERTQAANSLIVPPRRGALRHLAVLAWPALLAVVVLVVAWQLVAANDRFLAPRPLAVLSQLSGHPAYYLRGAGQTLLEAMAGLVAGCSLAFLLGVAGSWVPAVRRAVLPLAVLLNVTPIVAIAPALVAAFGFGITPKILVTAAICFFPMLIAVTAGLRAADPNLLEVLQTLHASRAEVLAHVRLPSSLPFLCAAARVCVPLSLVGAVVAELVSEGSSRGLGTTVAQASSAGQLDRVWAALACLALMGLLLSGLVALAERRVLAWHGGQGTGG
ncbi:MAG: ABC transporter permease [Acidimicrobiales bacterium]